MQRSGTPLKTDLEGMLLKQMREAGLPEPERQARLVPKRRFRTDFWWPDQRVALECHGGEWRGGRHGTGQGLTSDAEKQNLITIQGIRCYVVTGGMVRDGRALALLREVFKAEAKERPCPRCGKNEEADPHPCPYSEELYGDDEALCGCCSDCEQQCIDEI